MLKRKILVAGASILLGMAAYSPQILAQTKKHKTRVSKKLASQQQYVTAKIDPPSKTEKSTSSLQPSSSNTSPPAQLSSALGMGPQSKVHIDGFITAGAAWTNTSAKYVVPNHGTISNSVNAAPLSLVGLQFTADLAHNLQVVTQFVGDGDNTNGNVAYRVNVEWAFIRFAFSENYQVQAGRFRLPAFLYSQTQQVGYSYPWVTLPNEVYRIIPFENLNGITFITRHPLGGSGWNLTTQTYYGSNRSQYTIYNTGAPDGVNVDFNENAVGGIVVSVGNQNFTFRATYADLKLTGTFDGIPPLIPSTTLFSSDHASFYSFAMKTLFKHIVIIGEFANRNTPTEIASLLGYYGVIGYRIGKLLPLFTYARIKTNHPERLTMNSLLSEAPQDQQSYTLGLNYTFNSNLDIKVSVSQIKPLNGTFGLFTSDPKKKNVYLYGISLNAIF